MQFDEVDVVLDSKITIDAFHHREVDVTEFGQVISACRSLFNTHFSNLKIEFNEQQATEVAHTLVGVATLTFVGRAWDLDENNVKTLVGKQSAKGIVKLDGKISLPQPKEKHKNGMALNCLEAPLDVDIKNGGRVVVLNTKNLPLVGEVTYIVRGSGRVQVVGVDGKRVLETTLKAGDLFIMPRFFVVSKIAENDGMEWFSIITTPNPVFTHMAGSSSVWKALSPRVLQTAFNVDPEVEKLFRSKRTADAIFFPPPN
ncbi:putative 11-S seed storage protein, plant [Medicago truncatula]|uniref:Putative 11-S seed storage protein, plant n=1 Tax=Medicago truncatula TaxID=3880 RepID=A0A396HLX0_MEDTR|nr:putative 11-S seed storage protein, plant [Medicago truncatula]